MSKQFPKYLLAAGFIVVLFSSFSFISEEIRITSQCAKSECPSYNVRINFPQFSSDLFPGSIEKLNQFIRSFSDSTCNAFIQDTKDRFQMDPELHGQQSSICRGQFEVGNGSERVVSVLLLFSYSFPGEDDLNMRNIQFLNYDLEKETFLIPEDCFHLKVEAETWTDFVMEKHDRYLKPKFALPENFMLSEGGVTLFFKGTPVGYDFTWEELDEYFEGESLLNLK